MFKKLKRLFVIEEEGGGPKSSSKPTNAANGGGGSNEDFVEPVAPAVDVQPTNVNVTADMTDKFMDVLLGSMEKNNLDGYDYLEFKQVLQNLSKMEPVEEKRFKSAFVMAQTMQATPDHLIETAQHYLNILKKEESKFQNALASQRNKQITEKQREVQLLDQTVLEKQKQIEQLKAEIAEHQAQHKTAKESLSNAAGKLESTKLSFLKSYESLSAQISADIEKMSKYLKQ
jgi:serine protease inhibitor ecotin